MRKWLAGQQPIWSKVYRKYRSIRTTTIVNLPSKHVKGAAQHTAASFNTVLVISIVMQ